MTINNVKKTTFMRSRLDWHVMKCILNVTGLRHLLHYCLFDFQCLQGNFWCSPINSEKLTIWSTPKINIHFLHDRHWHINTEVTQTTNKLCFGNLHMSPEDHCWLSNNPVWKCMISTLILRQPLAFNYFEGNHQTEKGIEHKIPFMFLHNLWT